MRKNEAQSEFCHLFRLNSKKPYKLSTQDMVLYVKTNNHYMVKNATKQKRFRSHYKNYQLTMLNPVD